MPKEQMTKTEEVVVVSQPRYKSWALWLSIASLITYVSLRFFNVDISDPFNQVLNLALPILVGFGIINDPTVHNHLYDYVGQKWYQSAKIWIALAAFTAYVLELVTGRHVDETVNTLVTLLISILTAYGIIKPTKSPTEDMR